MAHNNYYLDLTAETYVVNDGAVLLRLHERYNLWIGPGGHIDPGEDASEATSIPGEGEEVMAECRWITAAELEKMKEGDSRLRPEIYRYAMKALELIG